MINAEDFTSSCDIVEDLENSIGGLYLGEYQKNTCVKLFLHPDPGFLKNPDANQQMHYSVAGP